MVFTVEVTVKMSMMMMMKMTTEACLSADFFLCAGLPGKHARICDLVNVLSCLYWIEKVTFFAFSSIKVIYVRIRASCKETKTCVTVFVDTLHDASLFVLFIHFC